ncbi:hypothetical protein BDZ94DRAFT_1242363 [Collybia nuda]|uniref:Uncharacterized protein n=1 Tax=Collybia nuda TaxID=64659 RepID=A0A9P5XPN5_9AGAR|nr:hypothetical protein BDZ94DRAFT_1242363 [Collybia nuda]
MDVDENELSSDSEITEQQDYIQTQFNTENSDNNSDTNSDKNISQGENEHEQDPHGSSDIEDSLGSIKITHPNPAPYSGDYDISSSDDTDYKFSDQPDIEENESDEDSSEDIEYPAIQHSSIKTFTASLTVISIWLIIDEFVDGFKAVRESTLSGGPVELSSSIQNTLDILDKDPHSESAVIRIASLWPELTGLKQINSISKVDIRLRFALTILATWTPFMWLDTIIGTALSGLTIQHVSVLEMPQDSSWPPTFTWDIGKALENTRITSTQALRFWLQFPSDTTTLAQYAVIDACITLGLPTSFFLLEEVWDLFKNPMPILKNSMQARNLKSQDAIIQTIHNAFHDHSYMIEASKETAGLNLLGFLFDEWSNSGGLSKKFSTALKPSKSCQQLTILTTSIPCDLSETPLLVFTEFLRQLEPSIHVVGTTGDTLSNIENNPMLERLLKKPDHFMPFRECAPTRILVAGSQLADPVFLKTPIGFWNLLVHRGVFYASDFIKEEGCQENQKSILSIQTHMAHTTPGGH